MKLEQLFEEDQSISKELEQAVAQHLVVVLDNEYSDFYVITDVPPINAKQYEKLLIASFGNLKSCMEEDWGPMMLGKTEARDSSGQYALVDLISYPLSLDLTPQDSIFHYTTWINFANQIFEQELANRNSIDDFQE